MARGKQYEWRVEDEPENKEEEGEGRIGEFFCANGGKGMRDREREALRRAGRWAREVVGGSCGGDGCVVWRRGEDGHGDGSTSFICRMKDHKISRCGRKRSGDCRANQTNNLILWHDELLLSSSPLMWTSSATQSYDPKVSSVHKHRHHRHWLH
ncbi:hypothetical protein BJ165DRAFT_1540608, partial [Panaeolus papilionaceus]